MKTDDGILFITMRDNKITNLQFSLTEEELIDICKNQNTLQLMIVEVTDEEDS